MTKRWLAGVVALFAVGWGLAAEVDVTILHTTDVHAYVGTASAGESGDWLRLATLIGRERQTAGDNAVLLIDTGDATQGTLVGLLSRGEIGLAMLGALRYDVWVPGNHDLDFGVARLAEMARKSSVPVVAGNLTLSEGPALASYRVIERGGARLAVIGMTTAYLPHWFLGPIYCGYEVEEAADAIERLMPAVMRERPDMIVLAIHQGMVFRDPREVNEVRALAYRFPQIDLILGGHTHARSGGSEIGSAWYVQPAAHARELARVVARIDTGRHQVVRLESTLLAVEPETPVDRVAMAAVKPWLDQAAAFARQELATPRQAITGKGTPGIDCALSEVICRAMVAATGADAALHGTLTRASWPAGQPVTEADLFAAIPYENYLCVIQVTAAELAAIAAEQVANRQSYTYGGLYGAQVEVDEEDATPIRAWLPGREWPAGERVSLAVISYTAAGGGGRYPYLKALCQRPEAAIRYLDTTTRDAVRTYLRQGGDWDAPPTPWLHLLKEPATVR